MKTKDAATTMPGMQYSFYFTMLVFTILAFILVGLMKRQFNSVPRLYESGQIISKPDSETEKTNVQ